MNSQLNLKNPNIILSFPPALTGLYPTINELPKSFLTNKMMELQAGAFQPRQPYILPCHQQMMQARINSLNTYMRTLRSLTPGLEHPNSLQSKNQKDEKMICEKSDLNEQDPKFFLKKEASENQSTGSFSSTPTSLRKEDASEKLKKKREKSISQISEFRKRKNYWLPHEDNMVLELMKTHGEKWTKIAACLGGRTGKQVRDRYLNYLKPSIKQKRWTPQEDELLEKLYKEHGNKWSTIASCLGDRTENQVKNRFYSGVRKGKYAHDKSVFSPDKMTENPLKLVKINSNFEKGMMPDLKSDVSVNLDKMPSVKEETFDMSDLLSQSQQTQMKAKELNEAAANVPCVKTFLMNQKFVFSNTEHHNSFLKNLKNLISSKVCDSQQNNDEKIGDPHKKIKCENSENPQDIKVKQEVL